MYSVTDKIKVWAIIFAMLVVGIIAASVDVDTATAETYPQFVANDVTVGATHVRGNGNPTGTYRAGLLHLRAGASGMTFSVYTAYAGPTDFATISRLRIMPHRGKTASDTTLTLEANEKATYRLPQLFDFVYVSAGGGDIWAE